MRDKLPSGYIDIQLVAYFFNILLLQNAINDPRLLKYSRASWHADPSRSIENDDDFHLLCNSKSARLVNSRWFVRKGVCKRAVLIALLIETVIL